MSMKSSNDEAEAPHTAIIPQSPQKTNKGTDIVLPDDVLRVIVTFADFEGLPALACACKTTRDAASDEDMLERDKVYVLRCFLALGGTENRLRRKYRGGLYEWKMRDKPSDNLAEWLGVKMKGGRVTKLYWARHMIGELLTGTIPAEIGALDGLTGLFLGNNQICGHVPLEIGRLTSLKDLCLGSNRHEGPLPAELGALTALTQLDLWKNNFTGKIPSTLANLTNLKHLSLFNNNFDTDVPSYTLCRYAMAQEYLASIRQARIEELETEMEGVKAFKAKYEELKAKYEPDLLN
eukprot:CAMPEP_0182487068 /NCGR_PEP_ID=MMETSP1319-20130603/47716_1 /TAXON_ID=172717 /ORGANISM="Bolidomonas pacifica, Strain RCC208" /LENGTH=292 /DNA_ID=CAMNT_0024689177 /DNA_START=192 /DNA_END=1071 /DNA_ORIENTATION=+